MGQFINKIQLQRNAQQMQPTLKKKYKANINGTEERNGQ